MSLLKVSFTVCLTVLLIACKAATVRQQDLDAWVGMPVEALDTHSLFLTIPMYRTITGSGIEIRNYVNSQDVASCYGRSTGSSRPGAVVDMNVFTTCSSGQIACNNIFYIKDGEVIEYAPTGQCFTDERVQPQARYLRLKNY